MRIAIVGRLAEIALRTASGPGRDAAEQFPLRRPARQQDGKLPHQAVLHQFVLHRLRGFDIAARVDRLRDRDADDAADAEDVPDDRVARLVDGGAPPQPLGDLRADRVKQAVEIGPDKPPALPAGDAAGFADQPLDVGAGEADRLHRQPSQEHGCFFSRHHRSRFPHATPPRDVPSWAIMPPQPNPEATEPPPVCADFLPERVGRTTCLAFLERPSRRRRACRLHVRSGLQHRRQVLAQMMGEDADQGIGVRQVDADMVLEAAGPDQRGIEFAPACWSRRRR